ncbi:MAG: hypothetical protein JXD22_14175 [Sedimentisphaerales bacterium]|nr:hypothetical protein [Sedimentisphaerales bacterium]
MKKNTGSIYILALTSAVVLAAVVLGLSYLILQFRSTSRTYTDISRAQVYADLGIRHAINFTFANPNWRQLLSSGIWLQDVQNGNAIYTVSGVDTIDGDFTNSTKDPVLLTSTATIGDVIRTLQVETHTEKMEFLNYRAVAGTFLKIENHAVIHGDIASNDDIIKTGGDTWVFGDARAVDDIGDTIQIFGDIIEGANPLELPIGQSVYDFYAPKATIIPYQNEIFAKLLSPTNNPWGATNPDGVYLMNCSDNKVVIKQSRIVGTLILVHPKNDSAVEISVNWQPARTDYPAFIILGGDFEFKIDRSINEWEINADLSLPGEPGYGSKFSTYDGEVHGMIFSTNKLILNQDTRLYGMVISLTELNLKDYSRIDPDPLAENPDIQPFVNPALLPLQGTWRTVAP